MKSVSKLSPAPRRRAARAKKAPDPAPAVRPGRPRGPYTIGTLRASLDVLDRFGERDSWSLEELTREVGEAKSRVFRILKTFEESGYVAHDAVTGTYKLGPRLFTLGVATLKYEELRWRALPPLQMLTDATGETAHIGILFGADVVTVQLVEGRHAIRMHAHVGKRSPAHSSALGKTLLAYFPEPEIDEFLRTAELVPVTPHTVVDRGRLKRQLLEIRRLGYAIDHEEREIGLRCVAAPITDHTGSVVASASISAPTTRLTPEQALQRVPQVKECARMISRMLGSPSLASGWS